MKTAEKNAEKTEAKTAEKTAEKDCNEGLQRRTAEKTAEKDYVAFALISISSIELGNIYDNIQKLYDICVQR